MERLGLKNESKAELPKTCILLFVQPFLVAKKDSEFVILKTLSFKTGVCKPVVDVTVIPSTFIHSLWLIPENQCIYLFD